MKLEPVLYENTPAVEVGRTNVSRVGKTKILYWIDEDEDDDVDERGMIIDSYDGPLDENRERTGFGTSKYQNGATYRGDFVDGQPHGQGSVHYPSGNDWQGRMVRGVFHGQGVFRWKSGDKYMGQFSFGKRTGKGRFLDFDGGSYVGEFLDNERCGLGCETWPSGNHYDGQFNIVRCMVSRIRKRGSHMANVGTPHGHGCYRFASGSVYIGGFCFGNRHGYGIQLSENGSTYRGMWENGRPHGLGIFKDKTGEKTMVVEGLWCKGSFDVATPYSILDKISKEISQSRMRGERLAQQAVKIQMEIQEAEQAPRPKGK